MRVARSGPPRPTCIPTRSCRRARGWRRRAAHPAAARTRAPRQSTRPRRQSRRPRTAARRRRGGSRRPRAARWRVGFDASRFSNTITPTCTSIDTISVIASDARESRIAEAREQRRQQQHRRAFDNRLREQIERGVRSLPEVARQSLREQETGVAGRENRAEDERPDAAGQQSAPPPNMTAADPQRGQQSLRREEPRAPHHPRSPVRPQQDVIEALGPIEIGDEQDRGDRPGTPARSPAPRSSSADARRRGRRQQQARRASCRWRSPWSAGRAPCRTPTAWRAACRSRRAGRQGATDPLRASRAGAGAPGLPCR